MHKKKLIALAIFLLLLIPIALLLVHPAQCAKVVGNISAKDLAEVKSFARNQIWSGTFPNFSWKSIKGLPPAVNLRLHMRLVRIEMKNNETVEVIIAVPKSVWRNISYTVKKGSKGWEIKTMNVYN